MASVDGLDLGALARWFAANVEDATGAPLTAELIAGGRSNLTYRVTDGTHEWVLRRPPLGHVIETAHDMGREYRVIAALRASSVPVPRAFALCTDPEVIGAPFYVMEHLRGRVLRNNVELATLSAHDARRVSEELVDVLAALHSIDFRSVGLAEFGRPEGFLARNLARWGKQWQANKTRELPSIEELGRRLAASLPESGSPAIVHGDYRLDNTMLAPDEPKIVAVLDWEMSTLGDPLTDVGLLLVYWQHWGRRGDGSISLSEATSALPGYLSAEALTARYAAASGRALDHLDYYVVFAMYKLAIILEGIHARFLMGKTLGEGFHELGSMVDQLVDVALDHADRSGLSPAKARIQRA